MSTRSPHTPGAVNAHTHLYSGLAPFGLPAISPPAENFVQILERLWWKLDRALDERALRASARYYVAESLLRGTTALVDHSESPRFIEGSLDVLADAFDELGMRGVLCYGATDRNGGRREAALGLGECRRFLRENRRPLVRGTAGLHASFTVSDETLAETAGLCRELKTVTHVHVAEDRADVEDAQRRGDAGPLERLLRMGAIPAGSILAHGVHLTPDQVSRADQAGCWLVQNPRSNEGNKVGYSGSLRVSGRVALGTDGYPADMDDERAALERLARVNGDRDEAWRARPAAGRQLVAERFADAPPELSPERDEVVWGEVGADGKRIVARLTIGGQVAVEDGRLARGDLEEIRAHAREEAPRLWKRMAEI